MSPSLPRDFFVGFHKDIGKFYSVCEYYSKIDWDVLGLIILNQVIGFFFYL